MEEKKPRGGRTFRFEGGEKGVNETIMHVGQRNWVCLKGRTRIRTGTM